MLDVAVVVVVGEPWGRVEGKGKGRWGEETDLGLSIGKEEMGERKGNLSFFLLFLLLLLLSLTHTLFFN